MEFNWDEFTEKDYINYCNMETETAWLHADECIGFIRVGEICCDLLLRQYNNDPNDLTLTWDVYVGGVDTGYGYSAGDALATGKYKCHEDVPDEELYPYDYIGGGDFLDFNKSMTYTEFKKMAEDVVTKFIVMFKLEDKANMKLHKW